VGHEIIMPFFIFLPRRTTGVIFVYSVIMISTKKRNWIRGIKIALIVYEIAGTGLYFLQDVILFRPQPLSAGQRYNFKEPFKEINIPIDHESNLNLVQFAATGTAPRGVVIYFHGNRDNISRYAKYAPYFTKYGYEVWMMDYPGFGKSTGKASEKKLYDWAMQVYKLARSRFGSDSIILYGKSLGTGIATQLASVRNCKRVILETPYYSIPSLAKRYFFMYPVDWFIHYKIPSWEYVKKIEVPLTIIHGTNDGVIPYSNALRLKEFLKPGDEFISVKDGSHNDCYTFKETVDKLDSLLRN